MSNVQESPSPGWITTPKASAPKGEGRVGVLKRITLGGALSFVSVALLYGVQATVQMLLLAVICTAGIGLILLLFLSWIVGWVTIAVWRAITKRSNPTLVT